MRCWCLNEQAKAKMTGEVALKVVPRATHLFEEPGALAQVADFAAAWFWTTLKTAATRRLNHNEACVA